MAAISRSWRTTSISIRLAQAGWGGYGQATAKLEVEPLRSLPGEQAPRLAGDRQNAARLNGVSESAGINRLETENERVLQRKLSQSLWPRTLRWEQ